MAFSKINNKATVRILSFVLNENKPLYVSSNIVMPGSIVITNSILIKLFLRIGVFGTFLGHGINALFVKASWIKLITVFGFSNEFATQIMPVIGILDIIIALSVLIYPLRLVLIWAVFWAFITALSRPIAGEPFVEFVERAANWVAPLVLFLLINKTNTRK